MNKLIFALFILLAFGLLFGCTAAEQTETQEETQNTTDNQNEEENNNVETEEENELEVEEETNDVEVTGDAVFEEFVSLITQIQNYKVTYDVTAESLEYSQVQYMYEGEIRTDATAQGIESQTYILEEGIYSCVNYGGWNCYEASSDVEDSFNDGLEEVKANPDKFKEGVTKIEDQTIIGQATSCFNLKTEDTDYDYCLNSNGVPLLIAGTSGGNEFSMTATDYETSVSAEVLNLPAEPQEMAFPGMQ
jgi:hypothetical protein